MTEKIERATWCKFTRVGLQVSRRPSIREWEDTGTQIADLRRTIHFWLGDWAIAGEEVFGEEAVTYIDQLADKYGFEPHTIMNDRSVCRAIPYQRRRPALSFAHHAAVSRLEPPEQDAMLRRAEQEKMSSPALRDAVKGRAPAANDDPIPLIYEAISTSRRAQAIARGETKHAIGNAIASLEDAATMAKETRGAPAMATAGAP